MTALALAAGSALILASAPAQYLGRQEDDLLYILLSQALAHGSYRLSTAIGRPVMPFFPPVWPALLLPLSWLCPHRLGAYQAFCAALQALVPWACFAWLRRRGAGDGRAALVALLCASSPLLLSQAGAVMSEAPFLLFLLALLATLDRPKADGKAAGGWLAALWLMRPAGLSLAPALAPLVQRKRDLAWAAALPVAALGAWSGGWWLAVRRAGATAGKRAYENRSWLEPLRLDGGRKLRFYASSLGGGFLPRAVSLGRASAFLGAALLLCALWGAARALGRRRDDPAAWALLGSLAMYAAWGWTYERYWITLLPLLWWACAEAWGRWAEGVLAALLALQLAFGAPPWARGTSWRNPELARTYDWLSVNLPVDGALASAAYLRDGLYAGRPSMPLPDTETAEEFASQMKAQRVRFALWQDALDIGGATPLERRLRRAREHLADPAYFHPIFDDENEHSRVFVLK